MPTALRKATFLGVVALKLASAKDTPSPNKPIPKPDCDADIAVSIRYNAGSARLYVESADGRTRGGCVTLEQIWRQQVVGAPLYAVDPKTGDVSDTATGTWLLTEEMYVEDGVTLKVCLQASCGYFLAVVKRFKNKWRKRKRKRKRERERPRGRGTRSPTTFTLWCTGIVPWLNSRSVVNCCCKMFGGVTLPYLKIQLCEACTAQRDCTENTAV